MSEEFLISTKGYEDLKSKLEHLRNVERPAVIKAIAHARGFGDLSENAEFSSAKEKQGFVESRIKELELKLSQCEIVDISQLTSDTVQFGATVEVKELTVGVSSTYQILGPDEADLSKGVLSHSSLVGKSLIGGKVGDEVAITTPAGVEKCYKILSIKFS